MPWLTPETLPGEPTCFQVFIPDVDEARYAFYGALMQLGEDRNWEQGGSITPEETAAAWQEANLKNIPLGRKCMRIGMIFWWPAGGDVPDALLCDGSLYSVDQYNDLWKLIGWSYGGTPGFDFAVPNLIELSIIGTDLDTGDTGGEAEHTLTTGEIPAHKHGILNMQRQNHGLPVGTHDVFAYEVDEVKNTMNEGGGEAHNNLPPYMKLRPFIQAK